MAGNAPTVPVLVTVALNAPSAPIAIASIVSCVRKPEPGAQSRSIEIATFCTCVPPAPTRKSNGRP